MSHLAYLPQYTQAHFAISVQVGVKPDLPPSCRHQLDPGRSDRVVRGAANQEIIEASLIWCVKGTSDESMDL